MKINDYIEHTLLRSDIEYSDIEKLVKDAIEYEFFGICINPCFLKFAKESLAGENVKLITVVNFPLASNDIDTTLQQIESALNKGADEIDTVINIPALKSGDFKKVKEDIILTKRACGDKNLKVIIETDVLSKDEIVLASKFVAQAGANFVKTSTGFVKNGVGAKVEDIKLICQTVRPYGLKVKASGGIKDCNKAMDLINAGASRLGTSSGVAIMLGEKANV